MSGCTIELAGVGGQGTMVCSRILGEAALIEGLEASSSEIHGMAQRGGVVRSTLRLGVAVAPLVPRGCSDVLVAFEPAEAVRALPTLKPNGRIVCDRVPIYPPGVSQGRDSYPEPHSLYTALEQHGPTLYLDAVEQARRAGHPRTASVVMVGAAWGHGQLPLSRESLEAAITNVVPPKTLEANLKALELGYLLGVTGPDPETERAGLAGVPE